MKRMTLGQFLRETRTDCTEGQRPPEACGGPFVTLSRQYGCAGYDLAQHLVEILNLSAEPERPWMIYHKGILEQLSEETQLSAEILEEERRARPSLITSLLRGLSSEHRIPGSEVRKRVAYLIRRIASQGRAIILGQGGAGATQDLPHGLSVRLEAPESWRVEQVMASQKLDRETAVAQVRAHDASREYVRKLYDMATPERPVFHLTYHSAAFGDRQIAEHIAGMLTLKGLWPERTA
jgi:hypothetical protein